MNASTRRALIGALLLLAALLAALWLMGAAGGARMAARPTPLKPPPTAEPLVPTPLPSFRVTASPRASRTPAVGTRPTVAVAPRGEQPVVLAEGTRSARFPNDIWVHGEADEQTEVAEFHAATKNFFMRIPWGASEPEAEMLVALLKREFGANTLVATFGHYSFPHERKADARGESLENFTSLPDGRVQGNFIVKHISSLPGTDVRSFRLLIFLESPVAMDINEFSWNALTIRFERGKARPVKP